MAHVTCLNLEYQIYLNQILHTSGGAWLTHVVCIPVNVALLFYALAIHTGSPGSMFMNAGLLVLALLAAWYVGMAAKLRSKLWGAVALAVLAGLWLVGTAGAWFAVGEGAELAWYLRPITLIAAASGLQAYSHLFEANVPPRANFQDRWQPVREFIWGDPATVTLRSRLLRLAWTPIGGLWGLVDEWWASAKLLPLYLLELLWALGYRRAERDYFRGLSLEALASGDPALDWVGVGGGASVATLGEACADDQQAWVWVWGLGLGLGLGPRAWVWGLGLRLGSSSGSTCHQPRTRRGGPDWARS
ncbi:hypothetical protein [Enhygromyxa salina]|uniref:hypothetical protein n=1 Tax=Enhygromyxa salina TaxID=215803 RepID=UPI0011BAC8B5|nr:hypothetical protein [Enhygromyxa salina]